MIVEQVRLIAVTMRIRHLPPHVNRQMRSQLLLELPPRPERPTRDVVMADGHTEQVPVGKGSEEYDPRCPCRLELARYAHLPLQHHG